METRPWPTAPAVPWVEHATWSRWLTRILRTRQPAVLVLSLPRSGSSWVGEALGCAVNALYLREPVTQSDHLFHDLGTVFAIDHPDLDARYQKLANRAYAGWPDFESTVVRFPERWTLGQRRSSRVVIKEVNPLACGWHIDHYAPRVVLLVRHPAAVALSWQSKGWLGADADSWARNGDTQGRALREALDTLARYGPHQVVMYENLCSDSIGSFKALYGFAGLTWEAGAEQFIGERTHQADDGNPWNTSRASAEMINDWRRHAVQSHVDALGQTYGTFSLPWYRQDRDFHCAASSFT